MRRLAVCVAALAAGYCATAIAQSPSDAPFKPLFPEDGSLRGWSVRQWDDLSQTADVQWSMREGVLHGGLPRGTWLVSDREYGDFELRFEFKLGPQGNSGLALRAPMQGDPAFDGLELQMADVRYNPEAKPAELTGALYRAAAPVKQVYKPEAWNQYEITLQGTRFTAKLNGVLIQDLDLAAQTQSAQRHDGSDAPPVKDRPRRGHLGFQELSRGEGSVMIRHAVIREWD